MKISSTGNQNAVLVEDREGSLKIDMKGDLLLTKNDFGVEFDASSLESNRFILSGLIVWRITSKSRVGRFLKCMKIVWRFCK